MHPKNNLTKSFLPSAVLYVRAWWAIKAVTIKNIIFTIFSYSCGIKSNINYLFFLFSTKLSTTVGSAKVVVSPN